MNHNLFETFSTTMQARGTANFITTPEGKVYSYAEALATSERIAGALKPQRVQRLLADARENQGRAAG